MAFLRNIAAAALLAGISLTTAWAKPPASGPDAADIYKKQGCVMCHGADGKGFAAIHTPDFTDPKWQASVKDSDLADAIKNGKPDTAMKPFKDKLSDDEIQALVKYIRSFNSEKKKK
jgi:mono/diheme cytochrome c family protein